MSEWQMDIMTEAVFICLHFILFIASYYLLGKRISQPAVLFSFIWFLITAAHLLYKLTFLDKMITPSIETYLIFLVGNISFAAGSFLINQYHVPQLLQAEPVSAQTPINIYVRVFISFFL
jgi:hypothetical protein